MAKPNAYILIRQRDDYPWLEVGRGLTQAGYEIRYGYPAAPDPGGLVITWNHYGAKGRIADRHRGLGGRHIVIENGYLRETGSGEALYSIAENGHNGTGRHLLGWSGNRMEKLGIEFEPTKIGGHHILVCGQRGGDYSPLSMPLDWPRKIVSEIRAQNDAPIWYRPHPDRIRENINEELTLCGVRILSPREPLGDHLLDCMHVCVYTSSAAVEAYRRGYRVTVHGPAHIMITSPGRLDRDTFFSRLSGELWTESEIGSGEPFSGILRNMGAREGLRDSGGSEAIPVAAIR